MGTPARWPLALAAMLSMGILVGVFTGTPVQAQQTARGPSASVDSSRTTDRAREASRDSVSIGQIWAGTYETQLRQRAFFRRTNAPSEQPDSGASPDESTDPKSVSVGGLVINDTRTTIGRDFYDVFYSRWETPDGAGNVTVRVREQPRPNLGTRIVVEVEGRMIFRANLRPRLEQIKRAAQGALARAHRYIKRHYEPRSRY